jgi:hypothetical protein
MHTQYLPIPPKQFLQFDFQTVECFSLIIFMLSTTRLFHQSWYAPVVLQVYRCYQRYLNLFMMIYYNIVYFIAIFFIISILIGVASCIQFKPCTWRTGNSKTELDLPEIHFSRKNVLV